MVSYGFLPSILQEWVAEGWQVWLPCKCNMNVLPIILTELWMDEYPKCPVRDKTNTEESPRNATWVDNNKSICLSRLGFSESFNRKVQNVLPLI